MHYTQYNAVALQWSQWSSTNAVIPRGNGSHVQGWRRRKIQQFVHFLSFSIIFIALRDCYSSRSSIYLCDIGVPWSLQFFWSFWK